jgi:hypothetical protein
VARPMVPPEVEMTATVPFEDDQVVDAVTFLVV